MSGSQSLTSTQSTAQATEGPPNEESASVVPVVTLAFLCFIVLGMPAGMLNVAWTGIRTSFSLSLDMVGTLLLASQIGYLTSSFLSGRFAARIGNGRLLALGAGTAAVGLAGYAAAPVWFMMVAVGILVGFGGGALDSGMNAFFAMNFGPRLMNWLHAFFGLGSTIGPFLITLTLVLGVSWRWGYVAVSILQLTLAASFMATRPLWQVNKNTQTQSNSTEPGNVSDIGRLDVALSVLLFFFIAGLEMSAGQWSYSLFTESRGIGEAAAGAWISIYWGSFTTGRIFFGLFGHRIPVLLALRVGITALVMASAMIWWPSSPPLSFAGLALMGFGVAPLFPLLMTATPARLGRKRATHVIGYQIAAASLGIGLLPWAAGFLAVRFDLEVIGPFLLVAALLLLVLHEALERRRPIQ